MPEIIPLGPDDFTVGPRQDPDEEARSKALQSTRARALATLPPSSTTSVGIRPPVEPIPEAPSEPTSPEAEATKRRIREELLARTGQGARLAGKGLSRGLRGARIPIRPGVGFPSPPKGRPSRFVAAAERGVGSVTLGKPKPPIELEGEHRDLLDEDVGFIMEAHTIDIEKDVLGSDIVNPLFAVDVISEDPAEAFLSGMIGPLQASGDSSDPFGLNSDPFNPSQTSTQLIQEFPKPVTIPGGLLILGIVQRGEEQGYRISWNEETLDWFPQDARLAQ